MIAPSRTNINTQHKGYRLKRGWRLGLAGLLCAAGVAVCLLNTDDSMVEEPQPQNKSRIKTVEPSLNRPAPVEKPAEQFITNRHGQVVKKIEEKTYVDERGVLRYEGGARVYDHSKPRKAIKAMQNDPFPKLKYKSDYEIATLISVQPGGMLFGEVRYDDKFKQAFVESLLDRNEPEKGDSDWDIELKEAVEDTKRELAERIKAGDDLSVILKEAREEARRLASYKREIEGLIGEALRSEDASDDDIRDTIKAANQMLAGKGIEPFREDSFLRGRVRILTANQRKLEALRKAKE